MRFRMPVIERPHHALVVEMVEVTRVGSIEVNGNTKACEFLNEIMPGLHSFTNKENRDKFVTMVNSQQEDEYAFKIALD